MTQALKHAFLSAFSVKDRNSELSATDASMSWDSCGGSLDVSLGLVSVEHRCYKDEDINKVVIQTRHV